MPEKNSPMLEGGIELELFRLRKLMPVFMPAAERERFIERLKEEVVLNAFRLGIYLPVAPAVLELDKDPMTPDGWKAIEIRAFGAPMYEEETP